MLIAFSLLIIVSHFKILSFDAESSLLVASFSVSHLVGYESH